jgi:outer membrane protein assembly factor BamE (lipoprotein component of BamABCDE complex)
MFSHVFILLLVLLPSGPPASAHASATGDLTVTAVVTSSVSVTFDSAGRPAIVVANAPADADAIQMASTQFEKAKSNPDQTTLKTSAQKIKPKSKGAKHASTR